MHPFCASDFLIKEMVALDGKLSNRYFSSNTLKV
jgi:hypothetical protein